jgi:flagellar hook-associated protein 2
VDQLAAAQQTTYSTAMAMTDKVAAAATLVISGAAGGPPATINVGTGTLSEVVAAINAAPAAGVSATAVQIAPGQYKLLLTSKVTGSAGGFTVSGTVDDTQLSNVTTAQDAKVTVPGVGQITSTSNTFQNVFPGVTFTVSKPSIISTLTVANDAQGMTTQVQKLVDALNSVLTTITSKSAYDPTNRKAGPLTGSSVATNLADQLSDAVFPTTPGDSLSQIGIQSTRNGTYTFDASAFTAKLNSDPATAQRLVEGLATRLQSISASTTRLGSGTVSIAIDGGQSLLKTLNDQVADWDLRLADMKDAYTRQFAALNTTLAKMQDQQSWLANQFSTMSAG